MEKSVKITVTGRPIVNASVPFIVGTHGPLVLDCNDIFKCIVSGGKVVELTKYGEVVLDLSNYDKENVPLTAAPIKEEIKSTPVIPAPVVEEPKVVVEPVVDEAPLTDVVDQAVEETKTPNQWIPPQKPTNNQQKQQGGNNNKK